MTTMIHKENTYLLIGKKGILGKNRIKLKLKKNQFFEKKATT